MGLFKKKKPLFSDEENDLIVNAIKEAEMQTSGEIRVFVESHCKYVDAIDRAKQIFSNLKMEKTEERNAVLFYMALRDKQLALFADEGIHKATGENFWKETLAEVINNISGDKIATGIASGIKKIGAALQTHFPYDKDVDKNELPDEIIFGS